MWDRPRYLDLRKISDRAAIKIKNSLNRSAQSGRNLACFNPCAFRVPCLFESFLSGLYLVNI